MITIRKPKIDAVSLKKVIQSSYDYGWLGTFANMAKWTGIGLGILVALFGAIAILSAVVLYLPKLAIVIGVLAVCMFFGWFVKEVIMECY